MSDRFHWNPVTHPFRALRVDNTNAPGMYGWRSQVLGTFATLDEAFAAINAPFPRGTRYACIDRADSGPRGWCDDGRWTRLATRYPKEVAKLSREGRRLGVTVPTPEYIARRSQA